MSNESNLKSGLVFHIFSFIFLVIHFCSIYNKYCFIFLVIHFCSIYKSIGPHGLVVGEGGNWSFLTNILRKISL